MEIKFKNQVHLIDFVLFFSTQQPQILLMKEGTDTSQGKPQLVSNINACQSVVDAVRTTLGPRGELHQFPVLFIYMLLVQFTRKLTLVALWLYMYCARYVAQSMLY